MDLLSRWEYRCPSGKRWFEIPILTDFLRLTALRGGNGQPRAAQFSVRMGFWAAERRCVLLVTKKEDLWLRDKSGQLTVSAEP